MKKRIFSILLALALCLSLLPTAVFAAEADTSWYSAGGTTFELADAADLLGLAKLVNEGTDTFAGKTVKLTADIDLDGTEWTPIGKLDASQDFKGEFDGNGKTISNITMNLGEQGSNKVRAGLFASPNKAYIHDFDLTTVEISASGNNVRAGALAANVWEWSVVENVTVDGATITVNGNDGMIGGAVGYVRKSQMSNVDVKNATITVNGINNVVGGNTAYGVGHVWDTAVVGNNSHWLTGTVSGSMVVQNLFVDCDVNKITINLDGNGNKAGGFFGQGTYNNHSNYFADCKVSELLVNCTAGESKSYTVGGFTAFARGSSTVTPIGTELDETLAKGYNNCSVSGTINGANGTYGGFVGYVDARPHGFCNATTDVDIVCTGTAGGFVGATGDYGNHNYSFTNCEAKGDVTGTVAGGFAGRLGLGGDGYQLNITIAECAASGTVSGTIAAGGLVASINDKKGNVDKGGTVTISECNSAANVTVAEGGAVVSVAPTTAGTAIISITDTEITGGTYPTDPGEYVADGYCVKESTDGTNTLYTVAKHGEFRTSKVTKQPTYNSEGVRTYYCANCGEIMATEPIAKLTYSKPARGVNVRNAVNGTVTVNSDDAREGTIVTVTVDPDAGYTIDDITVTDANGNAVKVTHVGGNKYSFVMPATEVTVRATFTDGTNTGFVDVPAGKYFYNAVNWAVANSITGGTTATTFSPYASCTRGQLVTFLWRVAGEPVAKNAEGFSDVAATRSCAKAVLWAAENGIVTGYSDGTFRPDQAVTRQQVAAILYRYAKFAKMDVSVGEDTNILSFNDALSVSEYAIPAFQWAVGEQVITGNGGNLLPHDTCTRAQIVTMLYRLLAK